MRTSPSLQGLNYICNEEKKETSTEVVDHSPAQVVFNVQEMVSYPSNSFVFDDIRTLVDREIEKINNQGKKVFLKEILSKVVTLPPRFLDLICQEVRRTTKDLDDAIGLFSEELSNDNFKAFKVKMNARRNDLEQLSCFFQGKDYSSFRLETLQEIFSRLPGPILNHNIILRDVPKSSISALCYKFFQKTIGLALETGEWPLQVVGYSKMEFLRQMEKMFFFIKESERKVFISYVEKIPKILAKSGKKKSDSLILRLQVLIAQGIQLQKEDKTPSEEFFKELSEIFKALPQSVFNQIKTKIIESLDLEKQAHHFISEHLKDCGPSQKRILDLERILESLEGNQVESINFQVVKGIFNELHLLIDNTKSCRCYLEIVAFFNSAISRNLSMEEWDLKGIVAVGRVIENRNEFLEMDITNYDQLSSLADFVEKWDSRLTKKKENLLKDQFASYFDRLKKQSNDTCERDDYSRANFFIF